MNFLLVLLTLAQAHKTAALIHYITPISTENETCTVNGTNLRPCYQLYQFNSMSFSSKKVLLLILPGVHMIPNNHTFKALNLKELEIESYLEAEKETINCQQTRLLFQNIEILTVRSLKFSSCALDFIQGHDLERSRTVPEVDIVQCIFVDNSFDYPVNIKDVRVSIIGCEFYSNNGAISAASSIGSAVVTLDIVLNNFMDNNRREGKFGTLHTESIRLTLISSNFTRNTAALGGAIYSNSSQIEMKNSIFIANHANISGGAMYCISSQVTVYSSQFEKNSADKSGGGLYIIRSRTLIFESRLVFNTAKDGGGAIHCDETNNLQFVVLLNGSAAFNSAENGGFAYLSRCYLVIYQYAISSNRALMNGGAIFSDNSVVSFRNAFCNVTQNTAKDSGGALYLRNSNVFIRNTSTVFFINNSALSPRGRGGAIFVLDEDCERKIGPATFCFVYLDYNRYNKTPFVFLNNEANEGSVLYGGLLDRCTPEPDGDYPLGIGLKTFKHFSDYKQIPLAITSETVKLCVCINGTTPDCSINKEVSSTKMRGETLTLTIAALDQDERSAPATVMASYKEISAQIGEGEERSYIFNICEEVHYHIYAKNSTATLVLEPEGPCGNTPLSIITINISMMPCSVGFEQDTDRCVCDRRLLHIEECNIDTRSIQKNKSIWLRYDEKYLKISESCPFDYCKDGAIDISFPDNQCANHRSGILCGSCQNKYSIVLGGSKCLQCTSSKYAFIWLTVLFAVAGVALVTFLLVCNITVSAGTLNGLIFYANTLSISGLTSLNYCSIHPILSVFISWVNLDLGIETCFYSGMDAYYKTWLQFIFPLYIWLLVGAIIIASYYSSTAMKIFGRNSIAILATLFLLSYSKILQTIITVFTFTQVLEGRADDVTDQLTPYKVWTYDGNIDYLKGRHIPLFVVALLVLLILFLPYTLVLIFGQCLCSLPPKRRLRWIQNTAFISFLNTYHAPYNKKHRYWTGLLLLTRCVLYSVFASSYKSNAYALLTNVYTMTLVLSGVLTIQTFSTRIYKQFHNSMLELCFLLNLVVLSMTLHYLKGKGSNADALCNSITASISISFVILIGIFIYHAHLQMKKFPFYISLQNFLLERCHKGQLQTPLVEEPVGDNPKELYDASVNKQPTTTMIELPKLVEQEEEKDMS